ncbi:MAG: hypothetical protein M3481_08895 [Actinomycetota bacterium]|nr:hypothetical protein [Actinomycetota bacterium]
MTHLTAPVLLLVVLALSTAAPAMASPDDVVRDCAEDGFVETDRHSRSDLREGRNRIPADLDAYSDCTSQINEALDRPSAGAAANTRGFAGGDGTGGGVSGDGGSRGTGSAAGGSDGGGPMTEEERREAAAAAERKRQLARADTESLLGDRNVSPGTAGAFEQADTANGISLPLLLAIIALVLGLAAGAVVALRRRNPELFAGTLGRIPFPRGLGSLSPFRRR